MDQTDLANRLQTLLSLDTPPVGLAFLQEPPADVPVTDTVVPSTCAFWRQAEGGVFYATAEQHANCLVGAMVMGFSLSEDQQQQLGSLVQTMCACEYLDPAEGDRIPAMSEPSAGILYGPLASLPSKPDVVLAWLSPKQAMLFGEAAGTASWMSSPTAVTGRPACTALPMAVKDQKPGLSFGCMGMRTFTEVADDRLLATIPGSKLDDFVAALERVAAANQQMRVFYEGQKSAIAGASS